MIITLGYGPSIIDHILTKYELNDVKLPEAQKQEVKEVESIVIAGKKGKAAAKKVAKPKKEDSSRVFNFDVDLGTLMNALNDAENLLKEAQTQKSRVSQTNLFYSNIDLNAYFGRAT